MMLERLLETLGKKPDEMLRIATIGSGAWGSVFAGLIEREFQGVPETIKRKIICENAAQLYGFAA